MGEIVEHDGGSRELATTGTNSTNVLAMVVQAAHDESVDAAKLVALGDLAIRLQLHEREMIGINNREAFVAAKVAAIAAMPRIGQDGYNTHLKSRYAKWETMQPIVNRVLTQHGLALSFVVGGDNGRLTVKPVLQGHGWTEEGEAMPLPSDEGPGRSKIQGVGSAISYGKRYAAMAMLNILQAGVKEDDDGAGGGGRELTAAQTELIDEGRSAALGGSAEYEAWFKGLNAAARGWLAMEGEHDKLKAAAAKV